MTNMMEYLFKGSSLDKIDIRLLDLLRENARAPLKELAAKCRISKQTVLYRINKLVSTGVIKGFYAKPDYARLGYSIYYLFIQTRYIEDEGSFIKELGKIDGCITIMKSISQYSYTLKIITTDLFVTYQKLEDFFNKKKIVTSHFLIRRLDKAKENSAIDEIDKRIIFELSANCRISDLELSRKLGLGYDQVHARVKSLIKGKFFERFMTAINFDREGFLYYSILLKFADDSLNALPMFDSVLKMDPLVVERFKCIGEYGYVFEIVDNNFVSINDKINKIRSQFHDMIRYAQIIPIQTHYFYGARLE